MIPQNGEKCKGKTAGAPDEEVKRFCHRQNIPFKVVEEQSPSTTAVAV